MPRNATYKMGSSGTADTSRGPSGNIWGDCPGPQELMYGPRYGWQHYDDFINFGIGATDKLGNYLYYIDTSNTVTQVATEIGGVVRLETDATDNDAPVLTTGGNTGGMVKIVSGSGQDVWFEARVRDSSAALTEHAIFVGLTEEGCGADNGIISDNPDTDIATVMADKDYIGFANFTNAAPVLAAVYKKAGGTDTIETASAHTIVLDAWVKLGMRFKSSNDTLYYYVNGVEVGQFDVGDAGTTNFPSGEELAFTICVKNGTTAAKKLDIDWVNIVQVASQ